jgi:hypothetical protein
MAAIITARRIGRVAAPVAGLNHAIISGSDPACLKAAAGKHCAFHRHASGFLILRSSQMMSIVKRELRYGRS